MIRVFLLAFSLLFTTSFSFAQDKKDRFFTDYELAKSYAASQGVGILMVFAGSDWCRPCIQFKKEILNSETFQGYAAENLSVVYLDFPSKKKNKLSPDATKKNEELAEKYNKNGAFPKILLFDPLGDEIGELRFSNQSPESFIKEIKSLKQ